MTTYVSVDDIVYNEGDAFAVFTVRLTGTELLENLTLNYNTVNGTATAGLDFTAPTLPVLIPAGSTTFELQIAVQTPGDGIWTVPEGFSLNLSTVTPGVVITNTRVTAIQTDADLTPLALPDMPEITAGNAVVDESTGLVSVSVTLDAPSTANITVDYTTQDASAIAGEDYTTTTGTLTILAGHTSATLTVAVAPHALDDLPEGREVFSVLFSNPVGATLFDDRAHVIIQDASDPVPTAPAVPFVSVQGSTVSEFAGYVDFLITLDAPSATDVSVHYATADGNGQNAAFAGTDYIAASGDITFAPGEVSKLVRVFTIDNLDTAARSAVAFDMDLTILSPINVALGDQISAQGFIVDDEAVALPDAITPVEISARSPGDILIGTEFNDHLFGNQGDDLLDGRGLGDVMEGARGNDVYIVEDIDDTVIEVLDEGNDTVISYLAAMTLADNVETLILGGGVGISGAGNTLDNLIVGNIGANLLDGGAGSDTLEGGLGDDTLDGGIGFDALSGGAGNDTYLLGADPDVVTEFDGEGTADTVITSAAYVLTDFVENLQLTGTNNIAGIGNAENNNITGNDGNNTLDGLAGDDTLSGGLGNDTYVVDSVGDVVVEAGGAGTADVVQASVTTTLSANVERLLLTGLAAIDGTGNAEANTLTGNAAANTLDGLGGNDTMIGGDGSDTYVVDSISDVVTEQTGAAAGTADTVRSSVSTTLSAFVEHLVLTGTAATGLGNDESNSLTGNGVANSLDGGLGNDTLDGGAGIDNLTGGDGDDTYVVDNSGDIVTELAGIGSGTDTVQASASYILAANVEALILTGSGAINGTGNDLDNSITGNAGNNVLDGGLGLDTLIGGAGDDTYQVDSATDVITEDIGEGTDTVVASVDFTLAANVENLVLTGTAAFGTGNTGDNTVTGNETDNTLSGADGNDVLAGSGGSDTLDGGAGADTLTGGAGNDVYLIDAGDVIDDNGASDGADIAYAGSAYVLNAGSAIDKIVLTGSGTSLTGNELGNLLYAGTLGATINGLDGNDNLVGAGGNDSLDGGVGNDTASGSLGADTLIGGAGNDSLSGGDGNDSLSGGADNDILIGGAGNDTLDGGAGDDTYFVDAAGDVLIDAVGGGNDRVNTSVNYTLTAGASIETTLLTGSASVLVGNELNNILYAGAVAATLNGAGGNDTLIGSVLADSMLGGTGDDSINAGSGNDTLTGGTGNDTLNGGAGDDIYFVDSASDVIIDAAGLDDRVFTTVDYTLGAGVGVERAILQGSATSLSGNELGNMLYAGTLGATLSGQGGNDNLIGAGGNDSLDGGLGNDTAGGALGDDTLVGGAGNDSLNGGDGNDRIDGGTDADILVGGIGIDTLIGGTGDDTYYVDNAADVLTETVGAGSDRVYTSVDYTLGAGVDIEKAILTGSASALTGNSLNNTLYAGAVAATLSAGDGADTLIGAAGADTLLGGVGDDVLQGQGGVDSMVGGTGNDTYYVDNAADIVIEVGGQGDDRIYTSVNYTIAAGQSVERLVSTGAANALTGNEQNNLLYAANVNTNLSGMAGNDNLAGAGGNDTLDGGDDNDTLGGGSGADTLLGGLGNDSLNGGVGNDSLTGGDGNDVLVGGAGVDTLVGGLGDDTYYVDAAGDVIVEAVGAGTDRVYTTVNYTLATGVSIDSAVLTGAATALTGNELINTLYAGAIGATLNGGGGNDVLVAGAGADQFVFDTPLDGANNVDRIAGYQAADTIALDNDVFTALGAAGAFNPAQLYSGAGLTGSTGAAQGAGIYYDTSSGSLYYDADGSGGVAGVKFATLTGAPTPASLHFVVLE